MKAPILSIVRTAAATAATTTAIALALALPATGLAQGVPLAISYQALLNDDAGAPISPGAPTNYPIEFRIFNAAEGGTLLWAEAQNVSVFEGSFSTLLGTGDAITDEPRPQLDTVFDGDQRYLQITVTDAATKKTFTPRQRMVSTPFAFRANVAARALSVADDAVITANLAGGSVTLAKLANNSVDTSKIAANSVTSSKIAANAVGNDQVAAGAIDLAKLAAAVADRLVPAGSVTAWAGIPETRTVDGRVLNGVPAGWIFCDGRDLSPTDYPELFAAIGYLYGGEGTTFFKVPDYRGYFLRGQGGPAGVDPNVAGRTNASPWAAANSLAEGSTQGHQFFRHNHHNGTSNRLIVGTTGTAAIDTVLTNGINVYTVNGNVEATVGGDETRPVSRYVRYIIKAH